MVDLSTKLIESRWVSETEAYLLEALADVELIGELHITEEAFNKISLDLQEQCRFRGKIQSKKLFPAIFMISLVFSGRYSQDETRSFWKPYAEDVWDIKYRQSFRTTCSNYFQEAKQELVERYGFDFPAISDGGVVRAVYWHTIIPAYLHDDFARWLSKNLEIISKLPTQHVSQFIKDPDETKSIAPTLRKFLVEDDTHDMAVELVNELVSASDLLASQHDVMEIKQLFPSLIQRELWDKFVAELERETLVSVAPQRYVRLEWVWSFEYEDWVLRLLNLTTESHEKPALCVWSQVTSEEALWNNDYQDDIWAEQQANGQWRVREVVLGIPNKPKMLDSFVYVYDDDGCIYEQAVPSLPRGEFQFYRITQQQKYAVPVDLSQVTSGEWLVSYQDSFELYDTNRQDIVPERTDFYVSKIMQEQVGHEHIGLFNLRLPLEVVTDSFQHRIELTKRRFLTQPRLSDDYRIPNTSDRLPPAYTSSCITLEFSEVTFAIKYLKIHITTPNGQLYEPFDKYAQSNGAGYRVDLIQLIPNDRIGTYTIDITYGFKSRLASPIEFSVIPHLEFSELDAVIYNPLNPPRIFIKNVTVETFESPNKVAITEKISAEEWQVTWTDLRSSYCRLHIRQYDHIVPLEWHIQRIYAWFEESTLPKRLLLEDLDKARIQFRGQRDTQLPLYIDNSYYPVNLNARGEQTFTLYTDQFRDILSSKSASVVPLEIAFDSGRWLLGSFVQYPQITRLQADYLIDDDKEWLLIDVTLSESWQALFEIRVVTSDTQETFATTTANTFENPILMNCHLSVGDYEIHIFAEDGELYIPDNNILKVHAPYVVMEASYDASKSQLIVSYELDNLRLGDYQFYLIDSYEAIVLTKPLNIQDNHFISSVDLISQSHYIAQIRWDDKVIEQALTFFVKGQLNSLPKISTQSDTETETIPSLQDDKEAWLNHLVQNPPQKLSQETLFQLAIMNPRDLQNFRIEQLSELWRPFARLAEINRPSYWADTYGLLPVWSLLSHAVMMTTNEEQSYWVYPEKILLRGAMGIGKIMLNTPQEGRIGGYARWSMRTVFSSRLHVWIPENDPVDSAYAELDELDMWPAYYDRLSGKFHGARKSAMIPGLDKEGRTYLVDSVHNYTLLIRINRTSQPLQHMSGLHTSIDRHYTQSILRQQNDWQSKRKDRRVITTAEGYRYATAEWVQNYVDNKDARKRLKTLVDTSDIAGRLSLFLKKIPSILQMSNTTLLVGALRFLNGMEEQVTTKNENSLMRLDCHVLALAIILRAYSLETQSTKHAILNSIDIDEIQLIHLLSYANRACPTLLEWALTWSEIFIVHSSS